MKRNLVLAIVGLAIAVAVLTGVFVTVASYQRPAPGDPLLFTVRSGEAFSTIRDRLADAGLIGHPHAVGLYALLRRYDRRVKTGTYRFTPGERPKDIVAALVRGDVYKVSVTIPEGFMYRQVAGVLGSLIDVDSTRFAALLTDERLIADLNVGSPSLEGYLFPDTYVISWGLDAEEVARAMVARLDEVFDEAMLARASEINLTRHEALTLASVIEAETRLSEERPLVSAVYHNRLRKGLRLEADPTVAYAMGGYKGRLFYRDLEIDSPYNTYKHEGLPPGPICSPGKASIMAALHPDTTSRAMYFVAESGGGHIFSETLKEHLVAVRKTMIRRSSMPGDLERPYEKLREVLSRYGSMVIAYSGGVDSGLLTYVARDILGDRMVAVTGESPSLSGRERSAAIEFLADHGIPHRAVDTHELADDGYRRNNPDRCYFCKAELFALLRVVANDAGFGHIAHGANLDDLGDHRPGSRAADELGVVAPLVEAGLDKRTIRRLARALGLPLWDKPAAPCLASRIPYYQEVTREKLAQIEAAEYVLKDLGFAVCRVRHHGPEARIEIPVAEHNRIRSRGVWARVVVGLGDAGFQSVVLEEDGFRSGRLNDDVPGATGLAGT